MSSYLSLQYSFVYINIFQDLEQEDSTYYSHDFSIFLVNSSKGIERTLTI